MYLKLTKEDVFSSYNIYQLEVKKKYLLDALFYIPNLASSDRSEIHYLLEMIKDRQAYLQEEMSA